MTAPKRSLRFRFTRRVATGGVVSVLVLGILTSSASALPTDESMAAPLVSKSDPFIALSSDTGAVGDVVTVTGNLGQGCSSRAAVSIQVGDTTAATQSVPVVVPVTASGAFSVKAFEIPDFLFGGATYGPSEAVTPGRYYFAVQDPCLPTGLLSTPFEVTGTFAAQPPSRFTSIAATSDDGGYWLCQAGGGVFTYGDAHFYGSLPGRHITPNAPIRSIAATPDGGGYWLVGADGGVFTFGDAGYFGSLPQRGVTPNGPIMSIVPTHDGKGYWLLGADGGVFNFGDAGFYGGAGGIDTDSSMGPTGDDGGYFRLALNGNITSSGDAVTFNDGESTSPALFDGWFSALAVTPDGRGVWRAATDGGVFTLGDAQFYGSLPGEGITPNAPIVGMARTSDGAGYWLVGADGGVFNLGDASFYGSAGASGLPWHS